MGLPFFEDDTLKEIMNITTKASKFDIQTANLL